MHMNPLEEKAVGDPRRQLIGGYKHSDTFGQVRWLRLCLVTLAKVPGGDAS